MSNNGYFVSGENYFNKDDFIYDEVTQTMRLKKELLHSGIIKENKVIPITTTTNYALSINLGNEFAEIDKIFYSITPQNVYGASPSRNILQGAITQLKLNENITIIKPRQFAFTLVDTNNNDKYFALESIEVRNTTEYHIYFNFVSNNQSLKKYEVLEYEIYYIKKG